MEGYAMASTGAAKNNSPTPNKDFPNHAEHLSGMSNHLNAANDRLASFIERIIGASPPSTSDKVGNIEASPQAVLHVAQFGARRIDNGLTRLDELLSRLETVA